MFLFLGIVTVSPLSFWLAVSTRTVITPSFLLLMAAFVCLVAFGLRHYFPRTHSPTPLPLKHGPALTITLGALAVYAALTTVFYGVETTTMWWQCSHLSTLYLMESGGGSGVVAWDPTLQQTVTSLFAHPLEPAFGLGPILEHQRPGNAAFLVHPFAFLSNGGLPVALAMVDFLVLAFAALLAARHLQNTFGIALLSLLFWLGCRTLSGYQLNETYTAMSLSLGLLHLLLRGGANDRLLTLAAGVVAGHLLGVRPVALLLLPAWLLLSSHHRMRALSFLGALALTGFHWFWLHAQALGSLVKHPALYKAEGLLHTRTLFAGNAWEWSFTFPPLNIPFHDALLTGPSHPLPTLLRLPLELLFAFGAPLLALGLVGSVTRIAPPRTRWGLLAWALPIPLSLCAVVELDYQKLSYVLLALAPLPIWLGVGLSRFNASPLRRSVLAVVALTLFVLLPPLLRDLNLPQDERPQLRYVIDRGWVPERGTADNQAAYAKEQLRLTKPSFLPPIRHWSPWLASPKSGWALWAHSQRAQRAADAADKAIDTPLMVWAAWRPAQLHHNFLAQTTPEPLTPPAFETPNGILHDNMTGVALYAIRLEAPAPTAVTVQLDRSANEGTRLGLTAGSDTVDEPRWLSFVVVDPTKDALDAPEITLNERAIRTWTVNVWTPNESNDGEPGWRPEPRVVSNHPWHLRLEGEALTLHRVAPSPAPTPMDWSIAWTEGDRALYRERNGARAHWLLRSRNGQVQAYRSPNNGRSIVNSTQGFPGLHDAIGGILRGPAR